MQGWQPRRVVIVRKAPFEFCCASVPPRHSYKDDDFSVELRRVAAKAIM